MSSGDDELNVQAVSRETVNLAFLLQLITISNKS